MAQWDDIKYFFDEGIAYMVELIKSKNDPTGTYVAGNDAPRFGWGLDGTREGTISEGAIGLENPAGSRGLYWYVIKNLDDEARNDLIEAFTALADQTQAHHVYHKLYSLARQLDLIAGAKIYIEANDERLSEHVQDVLGYLLPANVFMEQYPTIDDLGTLATFDYLAAGMLTYTDGAEVDTTSFGKHNLYLENTGKVWGGTSTTFRITLDLIGGTQETQDVQMPNGSGVGVKIDIGTHDTNMYVGVSEPVTITIGTWEATDQVKVFCEEERDVEASWWTP